jgi:ribonuclease-3
MHSALENVYEAVVAALYLDGGVGAATSFVERTLIPKMSIDLANEPENPKSALQEKLQEDGITPTYRLIETQGPPHDRTFVSQVYAGDYALAQGTGRTKKEAESQAAKSTLARLSEFLGLGEGGAARQKKDAEAKARAKEAKAQAKEAAQQSKTQAKKDKARAKQQRQEQREAARRK